MRRAITFVAFVAISALLSDAGAQSAESLTVTESFRVEPGALKVVQVQCPPGYDYAGFGVGGDAPLGSTRSRYIDRDGVPFDLVPARAATGLEFSVDNSGANPFTVTVNLFCRRQRPSATTVESQATVPARSNGSLAGICPSGLVPVGQAGNVDGVDFSQRFRVYVFGTSPNFTLLDDLPDGVTGPPTGIGLGVTNNTDAARVLRLLTTCAPLPNAQTIVTSAATAPGALFSLAGNLPDSAEFIGFSAVGGLYGSFRHLAIWGRDGSVSSQAPYAFADGATNVTPVRDAFIDGLDTRPKRSGDKASARAVIGILAVPSSTLPAPPAVVTVVEFYNASLDHYFITANAQEISDLDTGVHVGWQRTGQTFKAYAPGSNGRTGRRPVCRAYGNPAAQLDSHFYSASPLECAATLSSFNGAWLLEASEVFQMDLPDATAGACPAGGVPIYRVWNNRVDSNHRYAATLALRNQMVARGYVAEGYGPNAVTLCALP